MLLHLPARLQWKRSFKNADPHAVFYERKWVNEALKKLFIVIYTPKKMGTCQVVCLCIRVVPSFRYNGVHRKL